MKKIKIFILVAGIFFLASTCENENCHKTIPFANYSDKTLWIVESYAPPSDTSLSPSSISNIDANPANIVNCNEINSSLLWQRDCYEGVSLVRIYIYDLDVIKTVPKDTIIDNYMILRRYDLTVDNLQSLNWKIPYPPTEAMRSMKMYPAYGE